MKNQYFITSIHTQTVFTIQSVDIEFLHWSPHPPKEVRRIEYSDFDHGVHGLLIVIRN